MLRRPSSIAFLVAAMLTFGGVLHLQAGLADRTPVTISIAEYVRQQPPARWLRLTDVSADLREARVASFRGGIRRLFLPLRPAGEAASRPRVVLATGNPTYINLYEHLAAGRPDPLPTHDSIFGGLVRHGIDVHAADRTALAGIDLDPDFVILDEDEEPHPILGALLLAAGLAILVGGVVLRKKESAAKARGPRG